MMPMHDWTKVEPTIYHHFHQVWSIAIADALNAGLLPPRFSALIEVQATGLVPDPIIVDYRKPNGEPPGTATIPKTRFTIEPQSSALLQRANRIAIRHRLGEVVCIIEIVSPGNKSTRSAVRAFVEKTHEFLRAGVNVLLIDPFPSGPHNPSSLHKEIWDVIEEVPFALPAGEPLLLAAYGAGVESVGLPPIAYLEPLAVGAVIADMPAWIDRDSFVEVPLERTYQSAWEVCPSDYRYLVEHGKLPGE